MKNWVVAGYHAMNGSSTTKWDKITKFLGELNDQYTYPKLIYMDINSDTSTDKYQKWMKKRIREE